MGPTADGFTPRPCGGACVEDVDVVVFALLAGPAPKEEKPVPERDHAVNKARPRRGPRHAGRGPLPFLEIKHDQILRSPTARSASPIRRSGWGHPSRAGRMREGDSDVTWRHSFWPVGVPTPPNMNISFWHRTALANKRSPHTNIRSKKRPASPPKLHSSHIATPPHRNTKIIRREKGFYAREEAG